MGTIIVCCAHKGGVGKTVTVHNLSYALSRMGKRVLAVDFDDQANLTTCFGIDAPEQCTGQIPVRSALQQHRPSGIQPVLIYCLRCHAS